MREAREEVLSYLELNSNHFFSVSGQFIPHFTFRILSSSSNSELTTQNFPLTQHFLSRLIKDKEPESLLAKSTSLTYKRAPTDQK
jgi:hypothetical protein